MVIIVMGVSGCGKTTVGRLLARRLGWRFLDADAYHSEANVAKMSQGIPLTEEDRREWLATLRRAIVEQLQRGEPAVLACSALTRRARQMLRAGDEAVRFVYLAGSAELIRRRMEEREHFMPPTLLESQMATLEEPDTQEALRCEIAEAPEQIVQAVVRAWDL